MFHRMDSFAHDWHSCTMAPSTLRSRRAHREERYQQLRSTRDHLRRRVLQAYRSNPALNQTLLDEALDHITRAFCNLLPHSRALKFATLQSRYQHVKTLMTRNRVAEAARLHRSAVQEPLDLFRRSLETARERLLGFGFHASHFLDSQWPALLQDDTPHLPLPPLGPARLAPNASLQPPVSSSRPPALRRVRSRSLPPRQPPAMSYSRSPTLAPVQPRREIDGDSKREPATATKGPSKRVLRSPSPRPSKRLKQSGLVDSGDGCGGRA